MVSPLNGRTSATKGMITLDDAVIALSVSNPKDGGQSIRM